MISFASWSVLTADFLIVLHLSMAGVALAALLHLVNAKWRYDIRFMSVAFFSLYPLAFVLLLILLYGGSMTFPWVGTFEKLPMWNNLQFLAIRELLGISIMGLAFGAFIKLQPISEESPENLSRFKLVAAIVPFVYVLYSTMVAWDFEMTLLPNWESSMYAINHIVSACGLFLSTLVIIAFILDKTRSLVNPLPPYVYNYLAQMMLGFTILWIYTFFAQYLIIWYGNNADETDRIWHMQDGPYGTLFWTFFVLKFIVPFPTLALRPSRHNPKIIITVASSIVLGTWIERYTWISGTYPTDHMPMSGFFDIAATLLVFGAAFILVRGRMKRARVIR